MTTPADLGKILDANQALRELYEVGLITPGGSGLTTLTLTYNGSDPFDVQVVTPIGYNPSVGGLVTGVFPRSPLGIGGSGNVHVAANVNPDGSIDQFLVVDSLKGLDAFNDVGARIPIPGIGGGQTLVVADDEDITVAAFPGTTIVLYTALTAPRVVNLPPASSPSMTVTVVDMNNHVTGANTITLTPNGADTYAGHNQMVQSIGGAGSALLCWNNDGVSVWAEQCGSQFIVQQTRLVNSCLSTIANIAAPSGGATVDTQARTAIAAIISALSPFG